MLDLFSPLAEGSSTAADVAAARGISDRGADLMLRALAAMGLLRRRGDRYSLSPAARRHLLPGSPGYVGDLFRHMDDVYDRWTGLADAVRTGTAPSPRSPGRARREWVLAMAVNTLAEGREAARSLDLSGAGTLLDLGGGPGAWSLLFARANPSLRVTLFDRPPVAEVAREHIAGRPGSGRIAIIEGDVFTAPPRGSWDAVWVSHLIHSLPPSKAADLIRIAAGLTAPGGRLLVHDFVLDDTRTSPRRAAVFSVHMLAVTAGGRTYSFREIAGWMRDAGLRGIRRRRLTRETTVVAGVRPRPVR